MRVRWLVAVVVGLAGLGGGGWLASAAVARGETPPVRLGPAVVGSTPTSSRDGEKQPFDDDGDNKAVAVPEQAPGTVAQEDSEDDGEGDG